MNQTRVLQGLLVLWGVWNILNGLLSTFAQQSGASLIGWTPASGWTPELVSMAQQYGMVMLLLGAVYLITATDPVRYRALIWIVIAEQIVGIAYSAYGAFGLQQITTSQFVTQLVINLVVVAVFMILRSGGTSDTGRRVQASA
ncbi:MAG: hypothetical protein H7Z42_02970 [Roseiflexaceae bacterium]|nr:hypothetical protein [Roseiflexaceae bacterium]